MASRLNPYLNFRDSTRAAMEFYRDVLGGELTISTFGEFMGDGQDQGHAAPSDGVMHAQLETPAGYTIMASDVPPGMEFSPLAQRISISGDDADELRGYWDGLSDGAMVEMPLAKQMWGDEFGMLKDKFGVEWMVNIAGPASA